MASADRFGHAPPARLHGPFGVSNFTNIGFRDEDVLAVKFVAWVLTCKFGRGCPELLS